MQLAWVLCAAAVLSTATSTSVSIHDVNAYLHHLGKEIVHAAKTVGVEVEHGVEHLAHEFVHVGHEMKEGMEKLYHKLKPVAEHDLLEIDHDVAQATGIHSLHDFACKIYDDVQGFGHKECAHECSGHVHIKQLNSYCGPACDLIFRETDKVLKC